MDILIVTGMSGAGKTVVGNVLEDFGYYCIDNIPVPLITQFIDLYLKQEDGNKKIALIVDVRGCEDFSQLLSALDNINKRNNDVCKIIFLDASTEVLINRYKETRHIHPLVLSRQITLAEAIHMEREMLNTVKRKADLDLDTSNLSIALCRERIIAFISGCATPRLAVSCVSFGFKYGIPSDSDLLFDVRCFPNPFYIPELKNLTGLDTAVSAFVLSFEDVRAFLVRLYDMIDSLIPLYIKDGRSHLTVSIGCTGGKHRSVSIAEALARHFSENGLCSANASHRDIKK